MGITLISDLPKYTTKEDIQRLFNKTRALIYEHDERENNRFRLLQIVRWLKKSEISQEIKSNVAEHINILFNALGYNEDFLRVQIDFNLS